jgi:soluble lytic murein transglycosylase-like protein
MPDDASTDLVALIEDIKDEYPKLKNVPSDMLLRLIHAESTFDPEAESPKGAKGLMQIKPETYAWIYQKEKMSVPDDIKHPYNNVLGGMLYLNYLKKKFKTWQSAVEAYNVGPNAYVDGEKAPPVYLKKIFPEKKTKAIKALGG